MGKLCAPVRDEKIEALKQTRDIVEVFKGVMETLDLMRLDMANYTIQQIRPLIMAQVRYIFCISDSFVIIFSEC